MPNGEGFSLNREAMTAPMYSPHPWHVRMGAYRLFLPARETIPQWLADEWTVVMQEAVEAWARGDTIQPDLDYIDALSDEQVEKRITSYQHGYDKEWGRREHSDAWHDYGGVPKERYVFADMSMGMQRAIVSRWDALHEEWLTKYGAHYDPDFGYHWRITEEGVTVKVKVWETTDHNKPPNQGDSEYWETQGYPGGILGNYYPASATGPEESTMWLYVEGLEKPDFSDKGTK